MSEEYIHETLELSSGVMIVPVICNPKDRVVKIRAEMDGDNVTIDAIVNCDYKGEIYYSDSATLLDGDRIYAEPDGLVVVKSGASTDDVQKIEGRLIIIASKVDETLMIFRTEEA